MRPSQSPPPGYAPAGRITLSGNRRLVVGINLLSVPWFVVCVVGNLALFAAVRSRPVELRVGAGAAALLLLGTLAVILLALVLHEAAHGVVFWLLTRRRPVFGFKGWYAYASAPGWYFTRAQFLAVGFAPLVLLPVLALPVLAFAPGAVALLAVIGLIVNATGAIGDLYLMARLLRVPRPLVVEDRLDGLAWYRPGES